MTNVPSSGVERGQRKLNGPQTTGREYRNLSQPVHVMAHDDDVVVPMRDGISLLADVHRPAELGNILCWWRLLLIHGRYKILAHRLGSLKLVPAISLFREATYMSSRTAGGPVGPGARSDFLTVRNAATCTTSWSGPQRNLGRTAMLEWWGSVTSRDPNGSCG